MLTLCYIICGNNKPCKVVTPIKNFFAIPEQTKKYYVGVNPVFYEENNGAIYTTESKNIVYCELDNAAGTIGNYYKIPNNYIIPVTIQ